MSKRITVRVDDQLAESLALLCEATQQSVSVLVRRGLEQLSQHPETLADLLTVVDERSPEQVAAWKRNYERLTDPSRVHALLAKFGYHEHTE